MMIRTYHHRVRAIDALVNVRVAGLPWQREVARSYFKRADAIRDCQ
jgi:hypothetical protein